MSSYREIYNKIYSVVLKDMEDKFDNFIQSIYNNPILAQEMERLVPGYDSYWCGDGYDPDTNGSLEDKMWQKFEKSKSMFLQAAQYEAKQYLTDYQDSEDVNEAYNANDVRGSFGQYINNHRDELDGIVSQYPGKKADLEGFVRRAIDSGELSAAGTGYAKKVMQKLSKIRNFADASVYLYNVDSAGAGQPVYNPGAMHEGFTSLLYSLSELRDWVGEHEQAAEDIENFYGKDLYTLSRDEIWDWLADHPQMEEDCLRHFSM